MKKFNQDQGWEKRTYAIFFASFIFFVASAGVTAAQSEGAYFFFQRITGFNIRNEDIAKLNVQEKSVNDLLFKKIFQHSGFIDNRLATFVAQLSNEDANPFQNEDDYQAALILAITSDIDFRDLFTRKFHIKDKRSGEVIKPTDTPYILGNNYDALSEIPKKYKLVFDESQEAQYIGKVDRLIYGDGFYDGLFTTHGFGQRFFEGGTNRKPIRAIYDIFLCSKLESYKDVTLDPFYIGTDIDRNAGGNPQKFQDYCSGCHSPIDSQRGALAYLDFTGDVLVRLKDVAPKYIDKPKEYGGFVTQSTHWENLLVSPEHQARFGWREPTTGEGHLSYAQMIVNSEQFQRCMVKKLTTEFCELSTPSLETAMAQQQIQDLANQFRSDGYRVKKAIQRIVQSPLCRAQKVEYRLKKGRQYTLDLVRALNISHYEIRPLFREVSQSLSKTGDLSEFSAAKEGMAKLASFACDTADFFNNPNWSIDDVYKKILNRLPSDNERARTILKDGKFSFYENCFSLAMHPEFILIKR